MGKVRSKTKFPETVIHRIFKTNFSWGIVHYGKISISVFQMIFSSIDKIFISGGGLSAKQ